MQPDRWAQWLNDFCCGPLGDGAADGQRRRKRGGSKECGCEGEGRERSRSIALGIRRTEVDSWSCWLVSVDLCWELLLGCLFVFDLVLLLERQWASLCWKVKSVQIFLYVNHGKNQGPRRETGSAWAGCRWPHPWGRKSSAALAARTKAAADVCRSQEGWVA